MPKRSNFQHYNLKSLSKKQLNVNSFFGVDYSSQKFLVEDGRAIDLKNFLYKDGVVQKRNGIEQIFRVTDFSYLVADFNNPTEAIDNEVKHNEDKTFNGIWRFEGEDNEFHIIAHIGKLLYEIKNIDKDSIEINPIYNAQVETTKVCYEFESFKSFAFVGGKKLWFLGGNKYMCIRYLNNGTRMIFPVEHSDFTPIPTTTISITYSGSPVSQRQDLDKTNLMTEWRKNMLISGTGKAEGDTTTKYYEYTLDAPLILRNRKDTSKIEVNIEEQGVSE